MKMRLQNHWNHIAVFGRGFSKIIEPMMKLTKLKDTVAVSCGQERFAKENNLEKNSKRHIPTDEKREYGIGLNTAYRGTNTDNSGQSESYLQLSLTRAGIAYCHPERLTFLQRKRKKHLLEYQCQTQEALLPEKISGSFVNHLSGIS